MNSCEYIIMHHSATPDGEILDFRSIYKHHVKVNGWTDIGYHAVIEKIDGRYTVILGRLPDERGAHCSGMNDRALGVCLVGNFEQFSIPPKQWALAVRLVRAWCSLFNIPSYKVKGHRDYKATACPGKNFDLELFRQNVRGR